jgi:hypothetical protein
MTTLVPPSSSGPRPSRRPAALSLLSVLALSPVLLTACSSPGDDEQTRPTRASSPASTPPSKADAKENGTKDTAVARSPEVPELDGEQTLLARQEPTRGNGSIAFGRGKKGDALLLVVRCQGDGRVEVSVRPTRASFPVDCGEDEAITYEHHVAVGGAERAGTVSVEASSGVRWSLAVGRGEPPVEDTRNQ